MYLNKKYIKDAIPKENWVQCVRLVNRTNYCSDALKKLILAVSQATLEHEWHVSYITLSSAATTQLRHVGQCFQNPAVKLYRIGDRESSTKTIGIVRPSRLDGDDIEALAALTNDVMPPDVVMQVATRVRSALDHHHGDNPKTWDLKASRNKVQKLTEGPFRSGPLRDIVIPYHRMGSRKLDERIAAEKALNATLARWVTAQAILRREASRATSSRRDAQRHFAKAKANDSAAELIESGFEEQISDINSKGDALSALLGVALPSARIVQTTENDNAAWPNKEQCLYLKSTVKFTTSQGEENE